MLQLWSKATWVWKSISDGLLLFGGSTSKSRALYPKFGSDGDRLLWTKFANVSPSVLELGLQENSANPILAPTYDPALLARAAPLAADINYLLTLLPNDKTAVESNVSLNESATPLPPFPLPSFIAPIFNDPPKPLTNYISHVRTLSASPVTAPGLLAHAYVRYLGDLSGGQFIGARVKKSFDLAGDDGTKFYQFDFQKGGNAQGDESRAETKKRLTEVKDWYRRGMDEGVGEDQRLKGESSYLSIL